MKNFPTVERKFIYSLSLRPTDLAARKMIDRIQELDPKNLPEDWDDSTRLTSK